MDFDSMTEKEAFKAGFQRYCRQYNIAPADLIKNAELPRDPSTTWAGYLSNTNSGLLKDVKDYFRHYLPQSFVPGSDAWNSAPARLKNLPIDRALATAATTTPAWPLGAAVIGYGGPAVAAGLAAGGGWLARGAGLGAGLEAVKRIPGVVANNATNPSNIGNATLAFLGLPIAAGAALGGGLGWGAAKLTEPKINEDDLKTQEIEQAYKIQAKRLKARREYEQYRRARGESN